MILHGDYKILLDKVPNNSIDLILTDPPYLHIKGGMKSKGLNKGVRSANNPIVTEMSDFDEEQINKCLNMLKPKMKKKFNAYIFSSKLQVPYYLNWALKNKYQFDILIWDKCFGGIISRKFFSTSYEYIIRIYESGLNAIQNPEYYQKVQRFQRPSDKQHPAQKPVELIERLIELSSNIGDTILDPFMGSGSIGVACKKLNRNFIGIEIDENYFNIANKRLTKGE